MPTPWEDRYRAENDAMDEFAKGWGGMTTVQPVDPDDPPLPCGTVGCGRDATTAAIINRGTPGAYGVAACDQHINVMYKAVRNAALVRDRPQVETPQRKTPQVKHPRKKTPRRRR